MSFNIKEDWKAAETAIAALKDLEDCGDNEVAHSKADEVLLTFLTDIGHREVAEAWNNCCEKAGFWYA